MSVPISARGQVEQLKGLQSDFTSSFSMHGATVAALILIACSSVVESADMRLLEQGRGGQKAACSWLERWLGPSDGFAPRDACSGFSTAHLAMLQ